MRFPVQNEAQIRGGLVPQLGEVAGCGIGRVKPGVGKLVEGSVVSFSCQCSFHSVLGPSANGPFFRLGRPPQLLRRSGQPDNFDIQCIHSLPLELSTIAEMMNSESLVALVTSRAFQPRRTFSLWGGSSCLSLATSWRGVVSLYSIGLCFDASSLDPSTSGFRSLGSSSSVRSFPWKSPSRI